MTKKGEGQAPALAYHKENFKSMNELMECTK
jgi:hypothetical protein